MAAVMMQAHGTETMIVKDGNKYSADFRYNFDWEEEKQRLSIEGRHRKRGRQ